MGSPPFFWVLCLGCRTATRNNTMRLLRMRT